MSTYEFNKDEQSNLSMVALRVLSELETGERLRVVSSVLMTEVNHNGDIELSAQTDEHTYTIRVTRARLTESAE